MMLMMLIKFASSHRNNKVALANFAGHDETDFSHALCALPWRRTLDLRLLLPRTRAVLLIKLLLATLSFLLETLDNINGPADVPLTGDGASS